MLQKKVAIHYATVDEKPIHSTCHLTGYRERLLQKMTGKWLQFSMRWLVVITLIFGHVSKNFPCNISHATFLFTVKNKLTVIQPQAFIVSKRRGLRLSA